MTTKFLAASVLMDMAACMKRMDMRSIVEWSQQEVNRRSDALTNGDCAELNPELRIPASASDLAWDVPPAVPEARRHAEHDYQTTKNK